MHAPTAGRADLAAWAGLVLASFFWGTTFPLVKGTVESVDVFVFLFQRFTAASLLMLPFLPRRPGRFDLPSTARGALVGLALFWVFAFQTVGLRYTTASRSAFVTGMFVALTPLLEAVLFRRRPASRVWVCAGVSLAGLWLLCGEGGGQAGNLALFGDFLTLLCALGIAVQIVLTGLFVRDADPWRLTFCQLATVAVCSLVLVLARGEAAALLETRALGAALYTACFATVLAFSLQTSLQRRVAPAHAAIIFCLEPVFGALSAWLWGGESLGARGVGGAALVLTAMLLAEVPPQALERLRLSLGLGKNARNH